MKKWVFSLTFAILSVHAAPSVPNHNLLNKAWKIYTGGSRGLPYYSLQVDGRNYRGDRPWNLYWNILKDAVDYEGRRVLELGCNVALLSIFLQTYRGAESCLAVDMPIQQLKKRGVERLYVAAELTREAFHVRNITIASIDFDERDYGQALGYDYDVVFCMNLLQRVKDREKLMAYLSHFDHVIFEGDGEDPVEIRSFAEHGFGNYEKLGLLPVGKPRTLLHFYR